jgi:protein TonB
VTLRLTSGSALLDRAARDAVRGWRFRPAKRAGQTVVGWVDVPVSFRLTD